LLSRKNKKTSKEIHNRTELKQPVVVNSPHSSVGLGCNPCRFMQISLQSVSHIRSFRIKTFRGKGWWFTIVETIMYSSHLTYATFLYYQLKETLNHGKIKI